MKHEFLFTPKNIANYLIFTAAIGIFSHYSVAQTLYKIVGADGKVTFSDKPPLPAEKAHVSTRRNNAGFSAASDDSLPQELRTVAQKFPVTLYAATACAGCDAARAALQGRGVPFRERTIASNEDIDELKRISGATSLPVINVGSQLLSGYSPSELTSNLDLAGYPKESMLPRGYKASPATPLVAKKADTPVETSTAPTQATPTVAAPTPTPAPRPAPAARSDNPAGIRF